MKFKVPSISQVGSCASIAAIYSVGAFACVELQTRRVRAIRQSGHEVDYVYVPGCFPVPVAGAPISPDATAQESCTKPQMS